MGYKDIRAAWQIDPDGVWMQASQAIDWDGVVPSRELFAVPAALS